MLSNSKERCNHFYKIGQVMLDSIALNQSFELRLGESRNLMWVGRSVGDILLNGLNSMLDEEYKCREIMLREWDERSSFILTVAVNLSYL